MNKRIGFIGSGNMGQAMIGGIIKAGLVPAANIVVFDPDAAKLEGLKAELRVSGAGNAKELAASCDIIVLAVKPDIYPPVLKEIAGSVKAGATAVTIAPGRSLDEVGGLLGGTVGVVRTMPNTPALVGEGMTAYCANSAVTQEALADVIALLNSFGKSEQVPEKLMDAVVGISGSSPAYVFMFIEALADAGVKAGIPRDKAYRFAAQSVLGSAKMVLETGKHPGALKDMVCSPGGTTIEAVSVLEQEGLRSAVIKAVDACIEKSGRMGQSK